MFTRYFINLYLILLTIHAVHFHINIYQTKKRIISVSLLAILLIIPFLFLFSFVFFL